MKKKKAALSLESFTILMFAVLAKNSKINDLNNPNNKIACLPFNFKQNIENILCANNGWKDKFAVFIDVDDYFDDHFAWEMNFSYMIEKVLLDLGKDIKCDLAMDRLQVSFDEKEIYSILNKYNGDLLNRMEQFTNLLTDFIYTRRFQEEFCDYSASAVKKMHKLRERQLEESDLCVKKENRFMRLLRK